MASLNKVMVIGNITKDPEIRTIPNGTKVASFGVAVNESYTDKSGVKVDKTEFINVVMWRGLAEIAEKYLQKGKSVFIEGKMSTRKWEKDGVTRYSTEVIANNMQMLGGRGETGQNTPESAPQGEYAPEDDSLPF